MQVRSKKKKRQSRVISGESDNQLNLVECITDGLHVYRARMLTIELRPAVPALHGRLARQPGRAISVACP
jgi:hypothetical protein